MKLTDEQIFEVAKEINYDMWVYADDKDLKKFANAILSAAIPEGCGVWREEECENCKRYKFNFPGLGCDNCNGTGRVPVERVS